MKYTLNIFLIILFGITKGVSQDSINVSGILIDSYNNKPIANITLTINWSYNTKKDFRTNSEGKFTVKIPFNNSVSIAYEGTEYIEKSIYLNQSKLKETIQFKLRSTTVFPKTSDIDSTLVAQKVKTIMKKYLLDFSDMNPIFEPPGICRGFRFQMADSTTINIFIEKTVWIQGEKEKIVTKEKVTGMTIAKLNGEVETYGIGKPLICNITNKYSEK
jgi:hypothetical protein